MLENTHSFSYKVYEDVKELPAKFQDLFRQAQKIRDKAYAPYSNFRVGAAILFNNGKIITGNNQENAAYPSGLCAERTALFYAHAHYPEEKIEALFVTVQSDQKVIEVPAPPCGACRQVMVEFQNKQQQPIKVFLAEKKARLY